MKILKEQTEQEGIQCKGCKALVIIGCKANGNGSAKRVNLAATERVN